MRLFGIAFINLIDIQHLYRSNKAGPVRPGFKTICDDVLPCDPPLSGLPQFGDADWCGVIPTEQYLYALRDVYYLLTLGMELMRRSGAEEVRRAVRDTIASYRGKQYPDPISRKDIHKKGGVKHDESVADRNAAAAYYKYRREISISTNTAKHITVEPRDFRTHIYQFLAYKKGRGNRLPADVPRLALERMDQAFNEAPQMVDLDNHQDFRTLLNPTDKSADQARVTVAIRKGKVV